MNPVTTDPMPVFVIKAKDELAIHVIWRYHDLCLQCGLDEQAAEVEAAINEMVEWRHRHRAEVELPDHKHVPVPGRADQIGADVRAATVDDMARFWPDKTPAELAAAYDVITAAGGELTITMALREVP